MVPSYADGFYNYELWEGSANISILWVRSDGTVLVAMGKTLEDLKPYEEAASLEQRLPNEWNFIQDPVTGQWLLEGMRWAIG